VLFLLKNCKNHPPLGSCFASRSPCLRRSFSKPPSTAIEDFWLRHWL